MSLSPICLLKVPAGVGSADATVVVVRARRSLMIQMRRLLPTHRQDPRMQEDRERTTVAAAAEATEAFIRTREAKTSSSRTKSSMCFRRMLQGWMARKLLSSRGNDWEKRQCTTIRKM